MSVAMLPPLLALLSATSTCVDLTKDLDLKGSIVIIHVLEQLPQLLTQVFVRVLERLQELPTRTRDPNQLCAASFFARCRLTTAAYDLEERKTFVERDHPCTAVLVRSLSAQLLLESHIHGMRTTKGTPVKRRLSDVAEVQGEALIALLS